VLQELKGRIEENSGEKLPTGKAMKCWKHWDLLFLWNILICLINTCWYPDESWHATGPSEKLPPLAERRPWTNNGTSSSRRGQRSNWNANNRQNPAS
jgi:hypothetical protein